MAYQKLFNLMENEHNLILLESEMNDIIHALRDEKKEWEKQAFEAARLDIYGNTNRPKKALFKTFAGYQKELRKVKSKEESNQPQF
jgi:hypothetical protein